MFTKATFTQGGQSKTGGRASEDWVYEPTPAGREKGATPQEPLIAICGEGISTRGLVVRTAQPRENREEVHNSFLYNLLCAESFWKLVGK